MNKTKDHLYRASEARLVQWVLLINFLLYIYSQNEAKLVIHNEDKPAIIYNRILLLDHEHHNISKNNYGILDYC